MIYEDVCERTHQSHIMTFTPIGGKGSSTTFATVGHKYHSSNFGTVGSKRMGTAAGRSVFSIPHTSGLGSLNDGSYFSGNTHNALANGQVDKRPTPYYNKLQATGNQLERQTKRQRGGL